MSVYSRDAQCISLEKKKLQLHETEFLDCACCWYMSVYSRDAQCISLEKKKLQLHETEFLDCACCLRGI